MHPPCQEHPSNDSVRGRGISVLKVPGFVKLLWLVDLNEALRENTVEGKSFIRPAMSGEP